MDIKDSSGKIIGNIEISSKKIIINNNKKPQLLITDTELINKILNKDESILNILFNEYTLLVSEIAALYGVCYKTATKKLKQQGIDTYSKAGRRNASFGLVFSEERKQHISESTKGRVAPKYERTLEIRNKISDSLKNYYQTHTVSQETRQKLSNAWAQGKYNNSAMGRGHNGWFYSIKNEKVFYFRSLLELKYFLLLEEDATVYCYSVEPFQIPLIDNHHYTPDVLINNSILVELKPFNHLNWENEERWLMEINGAEAFCKEHNYNFKIIYDKNINFESRAFKRWIISNKDELAKYNIRFVKDLVWS